MATFTAVTAVNFDKVDLRIRDNFVFYSELSDDFYEDFAGRAYRDSFAVAFGEHGNLDSVAVMMFFGNSIRAAEHPVGMTGGTVEGLMRATTEDEGATVTSAWLIEDVSLPARDLYDVTRTPGTSDDKVLMRSAFAGSDTFQFSAGSDHGRGYGGDDVMRGKAGNDRLHGGSGRDSINGGAGSDRLFGNRGDDTLKGGDGVDRLYGGAGRDHLHGGVDDRWDVFAFERRSDSAVGSRRDVVHDFKRSRDDIDLSGIDAQSGGGNDAFGYAGRAAAAHSVWWRRSGDDVIVSGDVNGDRTADFEVRLADVSSLGSADFIL